MIKIILKNILNLFSFNNRKSSYKIKSDKQALEEDFKAINRDFQIAKEKLLSKYK